METATPPVKKTTRKRPDQLLSLLAAAVLVRALLFLPKPASLYSGVLLCAAWTVLGLLVLLPIFSFARRRGLFAHVGVDRRTLLPVLMKEMRSRMRGGRAPLLLLVAGVLPAGLALLVLALGWNDLAISDSDWQTSASELGHNLFLALMAIEGALIAVMAPALTAGSISMECEQQTFDFLLVSPLTEAGIVWGKLLSSLNFLGMVLLCALPAAGVGFMLGGVAGWELLIALLLLAATALCLSAVGLYCSARFRRTSVAVAVAYVFAGVLLSLQFVLQFLAVQLEYRDTGDLLSSTLIVLGGIAVVVLVPVVTLTLTSTLFRRKHRAPFLKWLYLIAGLTLLTCLLALGFVYTGVEQADEGWLLFGNPVLAFFNLFGDSFQLYYGAWFIEEWPTILGAFVLLLGLAWLALALTIRRLRRLRMHQSPTRFLGFPGLRVHWEEFLRLKAR